MAILRCCILLFIGTFFGAPPAFSQQKEFVGKVLKMPWTKTLESYCAGGSDYYVLKSKKEKTILDFSGSGMTEEAIEHLVGKKVKIKGYLKIVSKAPDKDDMGQHPVGAAVSCNQIEVKSAKKKK